MNKAVVFGGSGFIGSHLIDLLLDKGFDVVNVDISVHCKYESCKVPRYSLINACVNMDSSEGVRRLFDSVKPDLVFNFIATADIEECECNPAKSVFNNAGTNALIVDSLENVKNCLYVFASSVYAGSSDCGFYGISKKHCEDFIRHYFRRNKQNNNNYLILRYGTVYGPGATGENGIRKIIEKALKTKVISHYGTGNESREYIHVRDCARNTLKLCKHRDYWNRTVKLTGNSSIKSSRLVSLLKEILGKEYSIEFRKEQPVDHYFGTPYKYVKDDVLNYSGDMFTDFGMGLLEVIEELDDDR